uniref:Ig-like domain-containing protein n=1 Tax=Timema tahoe TaxID=61484 RepID=A0A7R9NWA5_9NEOP|nr:unnamed protein product [Timema tahoe]
MITLVWTSSRNTLVFRMNTKAILKSDVISVVVELSTRVQNGRILLNVDSIAWRGFSIYLIWSWLTSVKESVTTRCSSSLSIHDRFGATLTVDSVDDGESEEINYDSPRGGVSVITEKGDVTTSYLLIQRANTPDSGKYTCNPSNANLKTVIVHVLNDVISVVVELSTRVQNGRILFIVDSIAWRVFSVYLIKSV